MAQDITLLGAQYNDVPAVQLPKTGGGTARFDDASITTAVASDVTQGKVFLAADGTITTGTASGGGGGAVVVTEEQLSGGGIAKHITAVDISDTTAVASDVAQGKYFYTSSGVKTAGTASGGSITVNSLSVTQNGTYTAPTGTAYSPVTVTVSGGGGSVSPNQVNFIDYDGTIAYSYSRADALALDALPSNPSHTGLTAQGWNWSLANIKSYLTKYPDAIITIGQMYTTDTGDTRIYIFIDPSSPTNRRTVSVMFTSSTTDNVTIDWGDNSATETAGSTTATGYPHTYSGTGEFVIKLKVNTGTISFIGTGTSNTNGFSIYGTRASVNSLSKSRIKKVEIGNNVTSIGQSIFFDCLSLETLTMPNTVTSIGTYAFTNCSALTSITIPSGITSISNYVFRYCYSMTSVAIPHGITSIGDYVFAGCCSLDLLTIPDSTTTISQYALQNCYLLTTITIPDGVTSIGNYAFGSSASLTSITIPENVTSIGSNCFNGCYGVSEYHLKPTIPPTLGTTAFSSNQTDITIYVPQASLSDYQTADNWSTYASYMQGE